MQDIENPVIKHEPKEAPVWGYCENCGGEIKIGDTYREDNGGDDYVACIVCNKCQHRYAWEKFLAYSEEKTAQTRGPL